MLYNKYRPTRIEEIRGQEGVKDFLKATTEGNISHAIIFAGPSGIGKTTAARLLAQKIYCENPTEDGDVCGVCTGCKSVIERKHHDYLEIDSTSFGKVDQIRSLKDSLSLSSLSGKPRIVYFDEAHNLTKQAWDALLTSIEESKSNIFLFATTEPERIPNTIKTRSILLEFDKASLEDLTDYLIGIARKEGKELTEEAAKTIAFASEGSYRKALSLLEASLKSISSEKISVDDLKKVSGVFSTKEISAIQLFREGYYAKDTNEEWKKLIQFIASLPDNESALRGIAAYIETILVSSLKKYEKPTRKSVARVQFLAYMTEATRNKTTPVTKSSIIYAVTKYLERLFS